MFFNNWNAFLQARLATTDFVLNQRIAFFKGAIPTIARSDKPEDFSSLLADRLDDWLVTHETSRNVCVGSVDELTTYGTAEQAELKMIDEPFYSLSYDDMTSIVRTSLSIGRPVGSVLALDPVEDYTPTWFIVAKPSINAPLISANTDDIDVMGEVGALGDLTCPVLLKRPLAAGKLPKVSDFTTVNLPI